MSRGDIFNRRTIASISIVRSRVWTITYAVIAPTSPPMCIPTYSAAQATGIIPRESFNRKYLSSSNDRRIEVGTHTYKKMPSKLIAKMGAASA